MKITVAFDTLDEFQAYINYAGAKSTVPTKDNPKLTELYPQMPSEPAHKPVEAQKPEGSSVTPKLEMRQEQPPAVSEDYRIEVRRQLAALNRKVGHNQAAVLIKDLTGKTKLTEVPLADLPALMEAAKAAAGEVAQNAR